MPKFETYWGNVVSDQEIFNTRHCSLFGESPKCDAILSDHDCDGAVVFDGKTWRELDLVAMQESFKQQ